VYGNAIHAGAGAEGKLRRARAAGFGETSRSRSGAKSPLLGRQIEYLHVTPQHDDLRRTRDSARRSESSSIPAITKWIPHRSTASHSTCTAVGALRRRRRACGFQRQYQRRARGFTPSEPPLVVRMEELFRAAPEKSCGSGLFKFPFHRIPAVIEGRTRRGTQSGLRRTQHGVIRGDRCTELGKAAYSGGSIRNGRRNIRGFDPKKLSCLPSRHAGRAHVGAPLRISVDNPPAHDIAKTTTVILSGPHHSRQRKSHFRMIDHLFPSAARAW